MRKIKILQQCDAKKVPVLISTAAGQVMLFAGSNNNAAIVVMRDAYDALRRSIYYRARTKQLVNAAMQELKLYYHRLQHPGPGELRLFDVETFDGEFRANYRKDITNEDYFNFWEGVGCELYYRTSKYITSAEWKFTRHFIRTGYKQPEVMAKCMMVTNLLNMCVEVFDHVVRATSERVPATSPGLDRMLNALNIQHVLDRWTAAMSTMPIKHELLTDDETEDLKISINQINEMWADPVLIHQIQMDMMEEFKDEIYSSERMYKKILMQQKVNHRELEEEIHEIKSEEILKKLSNETK